MTAAKTAESFTTTLRQLTRKAMDESPSARIHRADVDAWLRGERKAS